ncbi:histidine kinase [Streptomyces sp. NPDC015661]|uniref:histidine kinase n=1 Tax=Streptomyces sp. NPDC015661 TaxID=3364961 RepID=UPI0036FCCAAC
MRRARLGSRRRPRPRLGPLPHRRRPRPELTPGARFHRVASRPPRVGPWSGVAAIAWVVLGSGWAAGFAARARRAREAANTARHTERAVVEERLRIARETHDIVSHSLSLIAVKAGVAGHVAQRRPEEALDALRVVEQTSRAATTDMRRALGVLRTDGGAVDVPLGPTPGAEVPAAIRVVATGDSLPAPSVTRRLIEDFTRRPGPAPGRARAPVTGVTEREREVWELIARGSSNDEIAARLHVSMGTVKTRIGRLLAELTARDRAQLVITAYECGIVSASDGGLGTR